jgi:lipopolysaccharide biosynthesis glycosyltransferase
MNCPVVLACDERFAMPLATTLRSIVEANRSGWPLLFYVLSDGISSNTQKKILESLPKCSASIQWIELDLRRFHKFSTLPYVSKVTYARLLIPKIFSDSVTRVLYLDCDLIVLDDLGPLIRTDLTGSVVGAVLDMWDSERKLGNVGFQKSPSVLEYFNAGVLLIDLSEWRKKQISEKALDYLTLHPDSQYSDQDALNVACDGLWKKLDLKWNFHDLSKVNLSEVDQEHLPHIVHFITREKPWNPKYPNLNARFFDSYRARTCFARTPWEILCDQIQRILYYSKIILKRVPLLKAAHNRVKKLFLIARRFNMRRRMLAIRRRNT